MSYYRDLREYLSALDQKGKLRTIAAEINTETQLHPLVRWQFRGLDEADRTGFLFENLIDGRGKKYNCRVATSVTGASKEVYAIGLKTGVGEIHAAWTKALNAPIPPKIVRNGPVKEEIHKGADLCVHGGTGEFAIPISTNGWESLPRLTAISWHTKDPDTGVINVGTYNGTVLGPTRTSCRSPRTDLRIHWDKHRAKGEPLPAAIVIGAVPAVTMVSVSKIPYGLSELDVAGALAGEPIEVIPCETIDLLVPATAEVVMEGYISTEFTEPDAASGEHTGYMIVEHEVFAFEVKCITHRKNPIWHDFISQMPPSESSVIRGIATEGRMLSFLVNSCGIPQVKEVAFHHCAGGWRMCVIKLQDISGKRTHNSIVWQALLASLAVTTDFPKMVIAVDDDIDTWDLESVFWAVTFRYQPHRDTKIIQGRAAGLDQSAGPYTVEKEERIYPTSRSAPQGGSAILMDATRKWAYTPIALPKREYMEDAKKLWESLGLPKLSPKKPWYGVSLGMWPEEHERQAGLAARGDFKAVAEELMAGRIVPPFSSTK
ncbi:MAG: UbiD family decarboxylase [Desulfobacterales bacterium]|nr:UbiD family decarboxylase [Desulfobacterales bacterium]